MQSETNVDLEMNFRKSHPKLYIFFCLFICVIVLAPCIAAPIIRTQIFGEGSNPYWGAAAVIGGIAFGIGLFGIMAAFFKKGMKPLTTALCLVIGGLMMAGAFLFR